MKTVRTENTVFTAKKYSNKSLSPNGLRGKPKTLTPNSLEAYFNG